MARPCDSLLWPTHAPTCIRSNNTTRLGCPRALWWETIQLERLREQPALIERAVEEFLRFDCPVQATERRATVAMDIGGCRVEPGDFLTPVIGAANRDPMRFARPDELDITRYDNRHLGFTHGPHYCLGAPLARLEGQIAIGTVVHTFARLEPGGPPKRRPHFYLRGLESLPAVVGAR